MRCERDNVVRAKIGFLNTLLRCVLFNRKFIYVGAQFAADFLNFTN